MLYVLPTAGVTVVLLCQASWGQRDLPSIWMWRTWITATDAALTHELIILALWTKMTLELLNNGTAGKYLLQEALGQDSISLPHHLYFTFMHLADAFIQSDLHYIQVIHFLSVCSLGIEPTTCCAANAMFYHWATGTHQKEIMGFFTKHDKEHHIYDLTEVMSNVPLWESP